MSIHGSATSNSQIPQEAVRFVFRGVWRDFYDWEEAYCQSVIKSLVTLFDTALFSDVVALSHPLKANGQRTKFIQAPQQSPVIDQLGITCLDYTKYDSPVVTRLEVEVINAPRLPAPPIYESVTPAMRSIHHGDDDDSMAFVPYSDELTFDALEHTLQYGSFSWQDKFDDPDGEGAGNSHST